MVFTFNIIISGATQSGKSSFVKNLLINKQKLLEPPPKSTYLVYKIWQPIYSELQQIGLINKFIQGVPEIEQLKKIFITHINEGGCIFIFDDIGEQTFLSLFFILLMI